MKSDLTILEREVVAKFLEGPMPELETLRAQAALLEVADRVEDRGGLSLQFRLPRHSPRLDRRLDTHFDDVIAVSPKVTAHLGFLLWVNGGMLWSLEGHTYGEPWPVGLDLYTLAFVNEARDWSYVQQVVEGKVI